VGDVAPPLCDGLAGRVGPAAGVELPDDGVDPTPLDVAVERGVGTRGARCIAELGEGVAVPTVGWATDDVTLVVGSGVGNGSPAAARAGPEIPVTPATATALTPTAACAATPAAVNEGAEPSSGVPTSQEVGPIAHRSFGADTARKARTTSGSN